jgi:hypothetical protein
MRVCQKWFPKTEGYWMDDKLVMQLNVLLKNIKNDWDFTIIVTGQGEVRVGKSKLAMDISCYWAYMINELYKFKTSFDIDNNFVFDGNKLIEKGNYLGTNFKHAPLIFDEAGADLEGRKMTQTSTQNVIDYLRECGQYNMLNILVMPEYFDLPKGLALSRSIFLIDVYYSTTESGLFQRGYFNFFSRRQKKQLYLKGKKDLNYYAAKYDFNGKFGNFYQVDEEKYRLAKKIALEKREAKRRSKFQLQRDACWYILSKHVGWTYQKIGETMENLTGIFVPHPTISDSLSHFKLENE